MEASPRSNSVATPGTTLFPPTATQQFSFKSSMVNWNGFSFDMEDEGHNRRPTPKDDVTKLVGGGVKGTEENAPATPSISNKLVQPATPSLLPPGSSSSPTRGTDDRRAGSPSSPRKRRQLTKEQQAALQAQQMAERAALRQKLAQIRKKRRTEQWYAMHRVLSVSAKLSMFLGLCKLSLKLMYCHLATRYFANSIETHGRMENIFSSCC